ncbi:MAG: DedA family protein [Sphingobium sp.]|nr:MAG: DedA family protein [Sphingobium sp.]
MNETALLAFITHHAAWAGPIIGVLAFLESLVLIGLFVPAIATMIAVGGLIGAGVLDPAPIILSAILGAVAGDWVSFALGRKMGPSVYRHRLLRGHRLAFARARLFFRRYGFASVFLGRFLGPVRATVPVVAGVMAMPQRAFQIANVLSALVWAPALLAPGYFAGQQIAAFNALEGGHILGLGIALVVIPVAMGLLAMRMMARPRRRIRTAART